jgi:hypothetical protein
LAEVRLEKSGGGSVRRAAGWAPSGGSNVKRLTEVGGCATWMERCDSVRTRPVSGIPVGSPIKRGAQPERSMRRRRTR